MLLEARGSLGAWADWETCPLAGCTETAGHAQALQGQEIDVHLLLDDAAVKFLNVAAARLGWSARSTHRALKVARTIADLAGAHSTQVAHVAEAMQYRRALRSS